MQVLCWRWRSCQNGTYWRSCSIQRSADAAFPRPRVYFASPSIIVMERIDGVTMDLFARMDPADVKSVLTHLAKLHAIGESIANKNSLLPVFTMAVTGDIGDLSAMSRLLPEQVRGLPPEFISCFPKKIKRLFEKKWFHANQPTTLIYGDIYQS